MVVRLGQIYKGAAEETHRTLFAFALQRRVSHMTLHLPAFSLLALVVQECSLSLQPLLSAHVRHNQGLWQENVVRAMSKES